MTVWLFLKLIRYPRIWPLYRIAVLLSSAWKHARRGNARLALWTLRSIVCRTMLQYPFK